MRQFFLFDTAPEATYDGIIELVSVALGTPVALLSLVDDTRQFFKAARGLPEPWAGLRQTALSHSICQHVVAMDGELVVDDALSHPLVEGNLAIKDLGVIAYLGRPVHDLDGCAVGSLCAIDTKPRCWTYSDRRMLDLIARMADRVIAADALQRPAA